MLIFVWWWSSKAELFMSTEDSTRIVRKAQNVSIQKLRIAKPLCFPFLLCERQGVFVGSRSLIYFKYIMFSHVQDCVNECSIIISGASASDYSNYSIASMCVHWMDVCMMTSNSGFPRSLVSYVFRVYIWRHIRDWIFWDLDLCAIRDWIFWDCFYIILSAGFLCKHADLRRWK